jgi:hypothetical protein
MAILRIEPNRPYTIALKYPAGKQVTNNFGADQLQWILTNGSVLYTPLIVGAQIDELGVKPGESFTLTKQKNANGVKWIAAHIQKNRGEHSAVSAGTPVQHKTNTVAMLLDEAESLDGIPVSVPSTRLEDALKTAVRAAAAAEQYGKSIGYSVRFAPADIKSLGISVYIGSQKGEYAA